MTPRPALALVSLILIAGAILLILLTLIAGGVDKDPINRFYFLEADTAGLGNARGFTRWTFWNACSVVNGRNDCPKVHAAYPFDPRRNFNTDNIFGGSEYYLETRFMFAFVLIGLFFAVCSLLLGLLALAAYVKGRDAFRAAGRSARLGRYSFGFMWAATACLFLAMILFCVAGVTSRSQSKTYTKRTGGRKFFGRKKSTRSRGSFIDPERNRRISKDDYS
ncbi:MAG: hypothetical protein LQ351_006921 [Letrouitia transgressa]|nr:MAG: hypothetical protein LQ351_006921 [Letrouitia transgressa]